MAVPTDSHPGLTIVRERWVAFSEKYPPHRDCSQVTTIDVVECQAFKQIFENLMELV